MKNIISLLSLCFVSSVSLFATTITSIALPSGTWGSTATWDNGTIPSGINCVDTIIINEHVYVSTQVDLESCPAIVLIVNDTLRFKSGQKLNLPIGSTVIVNIGGFLVAEGGGGNSNQLTIDQTSGPDLVFWNTAAGTLIGGANLDIELVEFSANTYGSDVVIFWSTASEINNDFFTLERSLDAKNFEKIANIEGAGNSSSTLDYSFRDVPNNIGVIYYRLVQTDFDGSTTTSNTIKAQITETKTLIFPNPADDYFKLIGKIAGDISIYNVSGQKIQTSENYDGNYISVERLEEGTYIVAFAVNGKITTQKLIIK